MVSILVLVDVALEPGNGAGGGASTNGFQSLFSWMSLLNLIQEILIDTELMFQSLFSWMSLLNF